MVTVLYQPLSHYKNLKKDHAISLPHNPRLAWPTLANFIIQYYYCNMTKSVFVKSVNILLKRYTSYGVFKFQIWWNSSRTYNTKKCIFSVILQWQYAYRSIVCRQVPFVFFQFWSGFGTYSIISLKGPSSGFYLKTYKLIVEVRVLVKTGIKQFPYLCI